MTITARYQSRCRKCKRGIMVGEKIEWSKGNGASHVNCDNCYVFVSPEYEKLNAEREASVEDSQAPCGNCGGDPVGIDCYHICPNSIHFYSPEQERQDEANYDPQEYYREGGFADPDPYAFDEPVK